MKMNRLQRIRYACSSISQEGSEIYYLFISPYPIAGEEQHTRTETVKFFGVISGHMVRWFASSNRVNWEIIKKLNVWGIPGRNKNIISNVKPGDSLLIYIAQQKEGNKVLPSALAGAFEIVSAGYKDKTPIFRTPDKMGNEVFPYRVRLKPVSIFPEPLEFKPLIGDLTFITNKTMWSGHLRNAMREIPEEDYQFILKRAGEET